MDVGGKSGGIDIILDKSDGSYVITRSVSLLLAFSLPRPRRLSLQVTVVARDYVTRRGFSPIFSTASFLSSYVDGPVSFP